ncbi:SCO family protein [Enterovibrio sp. ZSDZ35]|uniref:SCO family protein n=1 Tax=Enterovibrio qingdaonensis TaxID=2899818 RepID=A0ABT5QFH3_9GAMM|nr:SCO family protein [Enterovibrio sp. ZSDZ35]MDD1779726.1 SCO family protein [Enterovibrio sp. ZSDZ35]
MKTKILILSVALVAGLGARYAVDHFQDADVTTTNTITLQTGSEPLNLFDTADQRVRVVYFGYTHCPDVCPTSLAMLAASLQSLPEETLRAVRPIFITLDPERDTPDAAKEYAGYFHPMIEGSSGPEASIGTLAKKYGVLYQITELENSAMEYAVDHSSYFYFLSPDGSLLEKVPHTLNPNMISDAILRLTDTATP